MTVETSIEWYRTAVAKGNVEGAAAMLAHLNSISVYADHPDLVALNEELAPKKPKGGAKSGKKSKG